MSVPIHNKSYSVGDWSSDSVASSLHNSVDDIAEIPFSRPPLTSFPQNIPIVRQPTNKSTTSLLSGKEKEREKERPAPTKVRQSYVGPHLDDSNEPLSEADDFELFKMQTRMNKIVEFHQAAALAEILLAIEIYKERKAPSGEAQEISAKVAEHQKRMTELQAAKEEERKATVKAERAKRRSELRTRPGRSNTLIAPKPSVPTNPSWLTDLEDSVPSQLEPKFDLSKILSEDPNEQQNGVDKLLQQMFPNAYSSDSPSPPSPAQAPMDQPQQFPAHHSRHGSMSTWNMSSTSLHSTASASSSHANYSPIGKRRPSDARRDRDRPSPFGEEEFYGSQEASPVVPSQMNPFLHPDTSSLLASQLQEDPELAAVFAQYSAIGGGSNQPSPPVPSWATKPTMQLPVAPQLAWGQKESPSTPVASAWGRKKVTPSSNSQATPTNLSFTHHFTMPEQSRDFLSSSTVMSSSMLGSKPVHSSVEAEEEEEEPIWGEPPKKVTPPLPPSTSSSNKPTPAQRPGVPAKSEPKVEKAVPAPPVSKKQAKKQKQANKKNAAPASVVNVEESEPAALGTEEEPAESALQQSHFFESSSQSTEPMSFMSKMIPGMARVRKDSSTAPAFPAWDEPVSTPRPAPKIPAHLQESLAPKSEGTPRPNLFKKLHMSDSVTSKLANEQLNQSSTIKAPQWGSASNTANSSRVWNLFGSDSSAPKVPAQQPASLFGEQGMYIPGGFGEIGDGDDGGGGEDNDGGGTVEAEAEVTPQFWKTSTPAWTTQTKQASSPLAQQPVLSAAQRLRRVSEAGGNVSASRTPVAKATPVLPQPQATASQANVKKGKNKKGGKGKKAMVEEIPDEEGDNRGGIIPGDSGPILMEADAQVILEPKPSKPPRMFNSIISYGDEEDDETTTSSSFAGTPSTAASSPPDPFGGDEARLAAAIKELQEGTSKMQKRFGDGAWRGASAKPPAWGPTASEAESQDSPLFSTLGQRAATQSTAQQRPVWGQPNGKDKGKGKMTDVEDLPKATPAIHSLKRSKMAAGGKLF